MLRIITILNIGIIPAYLDNATYFKQNYFINPFEVGFRVFFMLKSGYSSSDKQLETVSQWKGLKFVYVALNSHAHKSEVTHP